MQQNEIKILHKIDEYMKDARHYWDSNLSYSESRTIWLITNIVRLIGGNNHELRTTRPAFYKVN